MALQSISVLLKEAEIEKFKIIHHALQNQIPPDQLSSPKTGKLGKDYLLSIKYGASFHNMIIEKFIYNDIRIVMPDENTKNEIDEIRAKRMQKAIRKGVAVDDTPSGPKISMNSVKEMIAVGNYESVIHVSKDINCDAEIIEKAINNLSATIIRAIDIAEAEALGDKALIKSSIKKLLEIASSQKIKSINKIDLIKKAGRKAIELCISDWECVRELINIANNNQLHNSINIEAAINFYTLTFSNKTKYRNELEMAVKKLNVRWLTIALDVVYESFDESEINKLNALIDYIKNSR